MIYITMRVERNVNEALSEYRDRLQMQVLRCPERFPAWLTERQISMSMALEYLLCQQQAHTERKRRSRKAKGRKPCIPLGLFSNGPLKDVVDAVTTGELPPDVASAVPDVIPFNLQG